MRRVVFDIGVRQSRGLAGPAVVLCLFAASLPHPEPAYGQAEAAAVSMEGKTCAASDCHADLKRTKFLHSPVIEVDCALCHVPIDEAGEALPEPVAHRFRTLAPTLELCADCHRNASLSRPKVHEPFEKECTSCHNVHGGNARYFLKSDPPDKLCLDCHADLLEGKSLLHGPVAMHRCAACHAPHTSEFESLLTRPAERLCDSCHVEIALLVDKGASVHEPAHGLCYRCHDPHGGERRFFLPVSQERLCASCHEAVLNRIEDARFPHREMVGDKDCSDCHQPHASEAEKLLRSSSMDLCLSCHDKDVQTRDGRFLPSVAKQIEEGAYRHGPIRQKDCTPCHAAHGSDDPRLLKLNFPMGFYAPYERDAYELCFQCHDPKMAAEETFLLTGFRNGKRNLHYVHVNREKGRTCRACHHEHASDMPFHLRKSVTYGSWNMELSFEQTPDGGRCMTACHTTRGYDRAAPVVNPGAEPQAIPNPNSNEKEGDRNDGPPSQ